jgi:hypothetical protein
VFCANASDGTIVATGNPKLKEAIGTDMRAAQNSTGEPFGAEMYAAIQKPEGQITEHGCLRLGRGTGPAVSLAARETSPACASSAVAALRRSRHSRRRQLGGALAVSTFRRYVAGQGLSLIGTWVETVAQGLLVLQLTHSGLLLGLTAAARHAPILLLTRYAGLLIDRFISAACSTSPRSALAASRSVSASPARNGQ